MSRQLTLSIALSVAAMALFALFGNGAAAMISDGNGLHIRASAQMPTLPDLSQLLPTIQ